MDYKESLLLPKTDFPMQGMLNKNEPIRYKRWDEQNIYYKMLSNRKDAKESFTLHDGPPYANGQIHIGHALNKILKDIIIKFHYFSGKKVYYTPGWDCHGLPIEQQVEKKLGKEKKETLPKSKIRELCRNHASEFIDIQMAEFKELGVIGDFKRPYKTMDYAFEAQIYRALCKIAKKGLLIERSKPVYWSWACSTALAEAEVEYEEKESDSIFVAFELSAIACEKLEVKNAKIVIWTTTPWTLPANVAIALNPHEEYVLTQDGYIVALKLHQKLAEDKIIDNKVKKIFSSKLLENEVAINPLNQRESKIVLGEHVSISDGTGAVHTAPGHGDDDYKIGLKYNLQTIMPVDDYGKFDETIISLNLLPNPQSFVGMHIFDANKHILEILQTNGALLKASKIKHSYPHCWRSHTPVIFRATKQWFILMDKPINGIGKTLREIAKEEIEKIEFYPASGKNRLLTMIENRPDWCISRQRDWGVPIAFFRDKNSKEVILDDDVLDHIAAIFEKEGCDAWWERDIAYLLPKDSKYDPNSLEKIDHILDVWFDSGSTWSAVLEEKKFEAGNYPADMYLEGSDQHRGWFQSSLLVSCAINHKAPYKSILTHGFTVDEYGEKMSKSKGNVIAPKDVLKEFGSEILRLWVALSDYQSDLKISKNILSQIAEQYRKIRNTLRFLLANTNDLDELIELNKLGVLDRWILNRAKEVFDLAYESFSKYDFAKGFHAINAFITTELSGLYLDICKDRLYCDAKNDTHRVASQTTMALIAKSLLTLIAPVLTYTVDEILEHAPKCIKQDANSVFDLIYTPLPEIESNFDKEYFYKVRESFNEHVDRLKKEKIIKSSLELDIYTNSEKILSLPRIEAEDLFLVSHISSKERSGILASFEVDGDRFEVYKSNMHKCPRCWKFKSSGENELCSRCKAVLNVA